MSIAAASTSPSPTTASPFSARGFRRAGRPGRSTAAGLMVMPGLIDIHSHPHHEPLYRGIREEHGVANMHMTGLYERCQAFSAPDDEARAASAEFAYCELLLSRRHLARRHLGAVGRLGRAVRQKRHARLPRARLRLGALVSRKRSRSELRLERAARPRRVRRGARRHRRGAGASLRPAVRRRLADADRHLHRGSAARQPRRGARARPAVHHALLAERQRGARDDPPPRQDAGPVGAAISACSAPARSSAMRCSSTPIPGCAGTPRTICGCSATAAPRWRIARRRSPAMAMSWRISAIICAPAW